MHACSGAVALLCLLSTTGAAQAPPAAPRIGVFLWHDSPNDLTTLVGIRRGFELAGVGADFVEHQCGSDPERAEKALAALRGGCDLVFALGTQSALLAKNALAGVPVVFAAVSDPVASGVVAGWDGSGTNLCGASNWIAPAAVLDTFRLAVPNLARLGIVRSQTSGVVSAAEFATIQAHVAREPSLGITLVESVAADAADVERAVRQLVDIGVDAIWIPIDLTIYGDLGPVRRALRGRALPLLTTAAAGVPNGAHVGAAVDYELHGRRAAALALRVLRGEQPGALPIDRMRSTLVRVNLGAARRDGVELPLSLLAVADELIDVGVRR